jgi:Ca2+-binding RTX toxin-like protein
MRSTTRQRLVSILASGAVLTVGAHAASGASEREPLRDQGTKGDDVMVGTPGDDVLAGGAGDDILIGDASSGDGQASGSGNDKLNGGDGSDIIVGDAASPAGAVGSGNDDISGGPGNDELVGDALVGSYAANGFGDARGTGNDEINGLPGTDLVVGDAAVHGAGTAECGGSDKLNGELNQAGGPNVSGLGSGIELIVGDCYSTGGDAIGAANDSPIINGGDGEDVLVGDNYAAGRASGNGSDQNMLGGDGNDQVFGDHHPTAADESGGGKDEPRGGDGNDQLEGGPSKDKCSGGDGRDRFTEKGSDACEVTTGAPGGPIRIAGRPLRRPRSGGVDALGRRCAPHSSPSSSSASDQRPGGTRSAMSPRPYPSSGQSAVSTASMPRSARFWRKARAVSNSPKSRTTSQSSKRGSPT